MASQRIFTRVHPDPNPTEVVFDPEKLLQNYRKKPGPSTPYFQMFCSFYDEEVIDIDNIGFDLRFKQYLFHSKSKGDLKEVVPDLTIFQSPINKDFSRKGKEPVFIVGAGVGQSLNAFMHSLTFGYFVSQAKNLISGQTLGQSIVHIAHLPIMAAPFAPLVLPTLLHDLPQNYS